MTSQNIDIASWGTLYIYYVNMSVDHNKFMLLINN
jgi:hypothetical protein